MCDNHINMYLWMNGKAKMKSKKDNNDEWLQLLKGKHVLVCVTQSGCSIDETSHNNIHI